MIIVLVQITANLGGPFITLKLSFSLRFRCVKILAGEHRYKLLCGAPKKGPGKRNAEDPAAAPTAAATAPENAQQPPKKAKGKAKAKAKASA